MSYGRGMSPVTRRLTRRTLLTDLGAAGVGLVVFGACSGSDSDPDSSEAPDTGTNDTATTDTVASDGELRFQHVSLGFVSAYVLVRGSEAAVVDTGQSGSRDDIVAGLDALGVGPSAVRHVVLTHNHGDHVGGLADLEADLADATVYGGVGDIEAVRTSLVLQELADGDEVFGMGVIATPGHTPGSISLFDTATGLLVAGDAINGDGAGGLLGPNPDFSADLATAEASVAKLAALEPTTAAFGHGGPPVSDDVAAQLAALAG